MVCIVLRGHQNNPVMTDREAFSMAVAKWRTLSDAEKEEWRVKPRRSGGGRGGSGQQRLRRMSSRFVASSGGLDEDMLSLSSVSI
jgi:hypothetical protein